jgi:O-antigen ligase
MLAMFYTSREARTFQERVATPLAAAVVLFLLAITFASISGVVFHDVGFPKMVEYARPYSYYLTFFLVLLCLNSRTALRRLLVILLIMAVIMGIGMSLQFLLGDRVRIFIGGDIRVESFGRFAGRVLPPGYALVWLGVPVMVAVLQAVKGRSRIWQLIALATMAAGLLFTFTRAMWMGTIAGIVTMLFIGHGLERRGMMRIFVAFSASVAVLLLVLGLVSTESENYMKPYVDRFLSTFNAESYGPESTIGARLTEVDAAWDRFVEHPWLGIGIGGSYSQELKWNNDLYTHEWRGITHIHNGYMLLLCKTGLIGLMSFVLMVTMFFRRAWFISRLLSDPVDRALVLGVIGSTVSCLVATMLQPSIAVAATVTPLAALWGAVEFLRWTEQNRVERTQPGPGIPRALR